MTDQELLLRLLNTTPVVDGREHDELGEEAGGRSLLASLGGTGSAAELAAVRAARTRSWSCERCWRWPTSLARRPVG